MKLKSFTVRRYRSITTAKKISVGKTTILIGPNNEGKSNILRALVTAMNILTRERFPRSSRVKVVRILYANRGYDWETDFPIALQEKHPNGQTIIALEFELTSEERVEFRTLIASRLSGNLPLQVALGPREVKVTVHKPGRGSGVLSKKSDRIARFITDRIDFQHIKAIRTASAAEEVVAEMAAKELDQLERDKDYQEAIQKIEKLQQPILDSLSNSIQNTLKQFLPEVTTVRVQIPPVARYRAMRRSCEIEVDDGTPTLLKYKGDGAQSLAALGIIRHASESGAKGKNLVIAIEEPESHLHPSAIHKLKQVIDELSTKHQVLITTHNPLFADRRILSNNVIVKGNTARSASSINQIRDILGVRASDNLRHAELVLVVEGEDDLIVVRSLLPYFSAALAEAIRQGTLAIDTLAGSTNLSYKLTLLRQALCEAHALLDNDKAGHDAFEKARLQGIASDTDVHFCIRQGKRESELEDLLDTEIYSDLIRNRFHVSLENPQFRSKKSGQKELPTVLEAVGRIGMTELKQKSKKELRK